jgi:hypothetical protein
MTGGREQELLRALLGSDGRVSERAAAALEAAGYVPERPLIVWVGAPGALGRAPARQALSGVVEGRAVRVAGARSPAPGGAAGPAVRTLREAPFSYRRALAALRAGAERWEDLRADRLLTALPASALEDLPAGLQALLAGGHEQLAHTLETYLDCAGDAKRAAAELWLHRTSLYYRLRRIEEIAGVDLSRGDDRLLCHVALRLYRLGVR